MVAEKEGISYEEQALAVIAEKADGGMRDALSIFDQAVSFCQGNLTYQKVTEDLNVLDSDNYFKLIDCALENNVPEMMLLLNGILDKGFDGGNMIQGLAQHVRNVLMAKDAKTLPLLETSEAQKAKYQQQAQKAPTPFLYKALQIANKCDINYRQSSNKRLLVELTLIEIGQITQPEDKDIPSAGRTPNRLKSLFQKIIAQLKPAIQGAGAELKGNGEAANNKHLVKPISKGAVKLGTIGMTFSNLKKNMEMVKQQLNPTADVKAIRSTDDSEQCEFNEDALQYQWTGMCVRMAQNNKELIGLSHRMQAIKPKLTKCPNIEIVADNQLLLDDMQNIKNRIRNTLVRGLHNTNIVISYRLSHKEEVKKILNKREVLENMRKENPALDKLCNTLKLVMT